MKFVLQATNEGRLRAIDFHRINGMWTGHHPNQVIATMSSGENGGYVLSSGSPNAAVRGFARLKAEGWPTRRCPIITMEDLEWIGRQPKWPEPEAMEEVQQARGGAGERIATLEGKLRLAEVTIQDVQDALGREVPNEGVRLAAMRIKGERDETRKRYREMVGLVEIACKRAGITPTNDPRWISTKVEALSHDLQRCKGERDEAMVLLHKSSMKLQAAYGTGASCLRESANAYVKATEAAMELGKDPEQTLAEFIRKLAADRDEATKRLAEFQSSMTPAPDLTDCRMDEPAVTFPSPNTIWENAPSHVVIFFPDGKMEAQRFPGEDLLSESLSSIAHKDRKSKYDGCRMRCVQATDPRDAILKALAEEKENAR